MARTTRLSRHQKVAPGARQVTACSTEAARQPGPHAKHKLGSRKMPGPPDNGWNPAIFLVLFGESEVNTGIHADNPTGWQLIWAANLPPSPSPPIYAIHPSCHNPPNSFWLESGTKLCWTAYPVA